MLWFYIASFGLEMECQLPRQEADVNGWAGHTLQTRGLFHCTLWTDHWCVQFYLETSWRREDFKSKRREGCNSKVWECLGLCFCHCFFVLCSFWFIHLQSTEFCDHISHIKFLLQVSMPVRVVSTWSLNGVPIPLWPPWVIGKVQRHPSWPHASIQDLWCCGLQLLFLPLLLDLPNVGQGKGREKVGGILQNRASWRLNMLKILNSPFCVSVTTALISRLHLSLLNITGKHLSCHHRFEIPWLVAWGPNARSSLGRIPGRRSTLFVWRICNIQFLYLFWHGQVVHSFFPLFLRYWQWSGMITMTRFQEAGWFWA